MKEKGGKSKAVTRPSAYCGVGAVGVAGAVISSQQSSLQQQSLTVLATAAPAINSTAAPATRESLAFTVMVVSENG